MMAAWVAFARDGTPNSAVSWPEFGETGQLLELGDEIKVGTPWDSLLCPHLNAMDAVAAE